MNQNKEANTLTNIWSNQNFLNNAASDLISSEKIVLISKSFAQGIPGIICEANETACKKLGYTKEDLRSMSFYDLIDEQDYRTLELKTEILNQDEFAEYVLTFKTITGERIRLNLVSFLLSTDGEIIELIIAEEIFADSREIQNQISPVVETFNFSFLQNSGIAALIVNSNLTITQFNNEFEKLSGYSARKMKSIKLNQLMKKDFLGNDFERNIFDIGDFKTNPITLKCILIDNKGSHLYVQLYIGLIEETQDFLVLLFDITGQSILQNALAKSEEKYRLLFQNASDMIFLYSFSDTGERSNFIEVNQIASEKLGYTKDELLLMNLNDIVLENYENQLNDYKTQIVNQKEEILRNKTSSTHHGKSSFVAKSGDKIPIEYSVTFFAIDNELLILSIVRDIRERLRAEEQLRYQNQFLMSIIKSISYPFIVIDANNHSIVLANKAAQSIYGYNSDLPEDIKCYQLIHNNNLPCEFCGEICPLAVIKDTRKSFSVDHIHVSAEGEEIIVEVHGSPIFNENGDLIQITESIVDVTEKRKNEKQLKISEDFYRTIFELNGSANAIIDENLIIHQMNSKMKVLLGYSSNEEVVNKNLKNYSSQKEQKKIRQYIQYRKKHPASKPSHYESKLMDRFGKPKNVVGYIDLIPGTTNTIASFIDVSEIEISEKIEY
ncbi:MAG: PAS domain-containing protein [Candidatus Heimdallarchaeaceae archaeon]